MNYKRNKKKNTWKWEIMTGSQQAFLFEKKYLAIKCSNTFTPLF